MADYESVLCMKQEVFVYRIPARTSNRGYRAAEWKLDEPDWTGRLKVIAKQKDLYVKLEDRTSGELFAQCPVESYPSSAIEQVLDSSRYFVVRIQDGSGRHAFIGLGFADRGDSFDLLVAIQDHFKQVKREETVEAERSDPGEATLSSGPKLDLSLKEGQTITLNFATKKSGESSTSKPRSKGQMGTSAILLPPPPGGAKVSGPPRPAAVAAPSSSAMYSMPPKAPSTVAPVAVNEASNLLVELSLSSSSSAAASSSSVKQPATSHSGNDAWDDFTGVGRNSNPKKAADPKTLTWENFD